MRKKDRSFEHLKHPVIDTRFQLLNFVKWEPSFHVAIKCYTSPKQALYLAYPIYARQEIIENPLLIDPESCLDEGYIMCESDSILSTIPGLMENKLCTQSLKGVRSKRQVDDLFSVASGHAYDVTQLVNKTLQTNDLPSHKSLQIEEINKRLESLIVEAFNAREQTKIALSEAATLNKRFRGCFVVGIPLLCVILIIILKEAWNRFQKVKINRKRRENERLRALLGSSS